MINGLIEKNLIDIVMIGDDTVAYQYKKQINIPKEVDQHEEAVYRWVCFR